MDSHQLFLLLAASMGLVLLMDLVSSLFQKAWLSEPMIAILLGFAIGPAGAGFIDLQRIGQPKVILEHVAQLTLAIGLMGVALRVPARFSIKFVRTLSTLLLVGMPLMWLSSSAVAYFTLGAPVLTALLLGAIITPTDPVISTSIVTGKTAEHNLTRRLRHSISGESGFNDGLAFPLVLLPIILLSAASAGEGFREWFITAWLQKTLLGTAIGILFGLIAGGIMRFAEKKDTMEITSILSYTVALSLTALAVAELAGANGILAVFVAGLAFDCVANTSERIEEENVQEVVNRLFTLPIFMLIGLAAPWKEWSLLGWPAVLFIVLIMLVRRLPVWIAIAPFTPGLRYREMAFSGWFGPVGIAALYYALYAEEETGIEILWPLTSLTICTSVLLHGATATPLARLLGRRSRKAHAEARSQKRCAEESHP